LKANHNTSETDTAIALGVYDSAKIYPFSLLQIFTQLFSFPDFEGKGGGGDIRGKMDDKAYRIFGGTDRIRWKGTGQLGNGRDLNIFLLFSQRFAK
jgi:hypothetical protein